MRSTSHDRVLTACAFRPPDRIPRFENFWQYPDTWQARFGDREGLTDVVIWYPDETPFPWRARPLGEEQGDVIEADAWGRIIRRCPGAFFVETLQAVLIGSYGSVEAIRQGNRVLEASGLCRTSG